MGISEKKQSAPFLPSALLRSKLECLLSVLQVARKAAQRCSKTLDELSFIFFFFMFAIQKSLYGNVCQLTHWLCHPLQDNLDRVFIPNFKQAKWELSKLQEQLKSLLKSATEKFREKKETSGVCLKHVCRIMIL